MPFVCCTRRPCGYSLVLLHDFPEFLCDYHFSFVEVIPHSCIQLRNLILSAFPRNMRLPDPFTPNLKVELLPEINQAPHVMSDYTSSLNQINLKAELDAFLKNRAPFSFLTDLKNRLLQANPQPDDVTKYNSQAINSLVLYVGVQAIAQQQAKGTTAASSSTAPAPSASLDIFQQLIADFDSEGRYLLLSAIANQLRYPNSHTHYFSNILLHMFAEASEEIIQEQITRVLIERLIVNRPHPYGLLITFIDLIRNQRFNFWEHTNFIRCAPEIERLFQSVYKSIQSSMLRA
ncbi:CCR4-Not complex component [Obelidium mucronatum]|nr:CCR4-Not complex component [Obelidium mucronatum]